MGAVHPVDFMYKPPPRKNFVVEQPVIRYRSISYVIDSVDPEDEQNTLQSSTDKPNKVRIFFLHGNEGDVKTTYDSRIHFLDNITQHLPRNLQNACDIKLITIDYPTYGGSAEDKEILGTRRLDAQIFDLFHTLRAFEEKENGLNIIWSYSMGTRYASALMQRAHIDFAYMQAPFYSISASHTSLFAAFCQGIEGDGLNALEGMFRAPRNIFLHLGEHDQTFPPCISLPLMKVFAKQYVVQPGANHDWFATLTGSEVAAAIMGKEIGELYLQRAKEATLCLDEAGVPPDQTTSSSVTSPS